jgi:polyhydroxyalkanoate synthesis regulator phasin
MAQGDVLKRYLDAGVAFTHMTRDRAEAIVQDLVENGEVRRKEAQKWIEDVLERSQRNTEELLALVRREVVEQLKTLGLDDLAKRAEGAEAAATSASSATTTATATAPPSPATKAAPKQAAAKKAAAAKKPPAKKAAAAKKATAKKSGAAKATKKA